MKRDLKAIVSRMTLEEKAGMCSGLDFWRTKPVERMGIPSAMLSDGPHGLRKQDEKGDHVGVNESIKAVCFPAGCAISCSFDRDLIKTMGESLGDECQSENVSVILGPAVNIKRSPLCGRNFEYLSEDPYLASEIATAHIKGVQSKNVGTSIKHFAANSQEFRRMSCSSEIDERTLHEIYLAAFETAIREGKPDTVMCSYNRINGVFSSENKKLLTDILRDEWGFSGYVMSDWGAVNNRIEALKAGLDLEMPASDGTTDREIVDAVKNGTLDEKILDKSVERILNIVFKFVDGRQQGNFDKNAHHELSGKIEENSMVLLKNNGLLPLKTENAKKIVFIGQFAESPRYQGGGSSHINSFKVTSALDAAKAENLSILYMQGYRTDKDEIDEQLMEKAVQAAEKAETAVVFAGLPDSFESEGYDRTHMRLPNCQDELIRRIAAVQPNIVVVLHNGSPVEMPWIDKVSAVLELYLGGQNVGSATVKALFGKINPSGRLAETFPIKLEDTPCFLTFPGNGKTAEYTEGIFVGYRYYDTKKQNVLFPFGHGLSYTTFEYSDLKLDKKTMKDTETLSVSVSVKNTGNMVGKEVIQLYVSDKTGAAIRPNKELKNFAKVELKPNEKVTVSMLLDKRAFAWYNTEINDWYAASGEYDIGIGRSSQNIVLTESIKLESTTKVPVVFDSNSVLADVMAEPKAAKVLQPVIEQLSKSFNPDDEVSSSAISNKMVTEMIANFPIRSLRSFCEGTMNVDKLVSDLNKAVK